MSVHGDGAGSGTGRAVPASAAHVRRGVAGTAASVVAVCALAVVPAYFVLLAYTTDPAGPWDHDKVAYSGYMAWIALVAAGTLALLTLVVTRAGWLRRWWYALPLLLGLAAVARLTVLAPHV
jgi:hypothetical protein